MENNNENATSQIGEHQDIENLDATALKDMVIKVRTEKSDLETKNKQLFERAKKAEGFEPDTEGNWIKIIKEPSKSEKKLEKKDKQSDELDYGMKAFLQSNGITEFDFVQKQIDESGISLEKLISNGYFQSQLKEFRDQKAIEKAVPGQQRTAGENSKSKAEFWLEKGELPPNTPENVNLRREVLNKRIEVERGSTRFSSTPIVQGK